MKIIQSSKLVIDPRVSIIIPSYNRAETVKCTIDSILSQQCSFNFEIIIGDDLSTDTTREVLEDYQKRYPQQIVLLFHDQNIGLGSNWATCIKYCRGKYIANCDNDDYWHNPEKLQLQVDFMEANIQYGAIHTDYRKHNRKTGEITNLTAKNSIKLNEPLQDSIMNGNFQCCNATVMYRKELLVRYVNLEDYVKYQFTLQDWNTWMILSNYTEFYCMPVSTATFGIDSESITRPASFENLELRFNKEKECYRYICEMFPEKFPFIDSDYETYAKNSLLSLAYKRKDFKKAKQYGIILKKNTLKIRCSQNRLLFWLFIVLKKLIRAK